jgi:hypothetical protein
MGIETLLGAGAVLIGSAMQSDATSSAASDQAGAANNATAEQRRQYDLTREDFAPYRAAGTAALGQLQTDINTPTTAADVMADPGYQFGLNQGQQALDRKIAAMGGRVSGAALKASARYGADYATAGYSAAYQRRQDRLNRLASLAGIGQTSTSASATAGANAANNISDIMMTQGTNAGAARLAQANIWGNAGNQIAALYGRMPAATPQPSYGAGNWQPGANDGFYTNPQAGP